MEDGATFLLPGRRQLRSAAALGRTPGSASPSFRPPHSTAEPASGQPNLNPSLRDPSERQVAVHRRRGRLWTQPHLGTSTTETICCDRPDSPLRIGLRFLRLGAPPDTPYVPVELGGGTDDMFVAYLRIPTLRPCPAYAVVMVAQPPPDSGGVWACTTWCVP